MAPRSVLDTCGWAATSAKVFGRYLRARARDIARREYPRPYGATKDTACRCYLRGPDGVSGLTPSGTWGERKYSTPTALLTATEDYQLGAVGGAARGCEPAGGWELWQEEKRCVTLASVVRASRMSDFKRF